MNEKIENLNNIYINIIYEVFIDIIISSKNYIIFYFIY